MLKKWNRLTKKSFEESAKGNLFASLQHFKYVPALWTKVGLVWRPISPILPSFLPLFCLAETGGYWSEAKSREREKQRANWGRSTIVWIRKPIGWMDGWIMGIGGHGSDIWISCQAASSLFEEEEYSYGITLKTHLRSIWPPIHHKGQICEEATKTHDSWVDHFWWIVFWGAIFSIILTG